jgi:DNA-binding transcriptional LysR family regulator
MSPDVEQFLPEVTMPFANLQDAFSRVAQNVGKPSGTLRVSVVAAFGREYLMPMLSEFLRRHPSIVLDWHLDNRLT